MKKFLSVVCAAALICCVSSGSALAAKKSPVTMQVSTVETETVSKEAQKLYDIVEKANAQIDKAVAKAQKTPVDDVEWLLKKIDQIASSVFAYADKIGAEVECNYVEYTVDGQIVLVDPLHVVHITK